MDMMTREVLGPLKIMALRQLQGKSAAHTRRRTQTLELELIEASFCQVFYTMRCRFLSHWYHHHHPIQEDGWKEDEKTDLKESRKSITLKVSVFCPLNARFF